MIASKTGKRTVITFGTFDCTSIAHFKILERAAVLGDKLIVGVSSDALNYSKKKRYPYFNQKERRELIAHLPFVTDTFLEESLELKARYIQDYQADILVMGDDWEGKFDQVCSENDCQAIYLPRTEIISTSEMVSRIEDRVYEKLKIKKD